MMKSFSSKIGIAIICAFVILAVFAPWFSPHDPDSYHIEKSFAGPSYEYPLGNDANGRDILSRVIYGARISLGIAISVVSVSLVFGTLVGLIAGFFGGIVDRIFIFVSDVFLAFPGFLFAIAIAAFLQPSISNVIFILCLKGWVSYARLVRGQTLALKGRAFIAAGKALGMGLPRLFAKHLLPNMMGPIVVNASFGMAGVIMIESSLSFLGLGVPSGTPSWGAMLDQGTRFLLVAPHLSIYPGIAIALIVLAFNFVGDALRDKLSPRKQG